MSPGDTEGKFSSVILGALGLDDGTVGVGSVFEGTDGSSVHKLAYIQAQTTPREALYQAALTSLTAAARAGVTRLTVYIDDPRVVDELTRRGPVPHRLQPLFVQIRCRANALGGVHFRLADAARVYRARRLANMALSSGQPIEVQRSARGRQLAFSEDAVA